ncbi:MULTISPECIES: hypothetical protein [Pseudomonas]|uniref:hypothetical protein n=1 Tax=Pseudomonas TaxID=286 RepID=UPI0011B7708C|nr:MULTISPECIES: hypothetical protein [Pseudomonas]MBH3383437.1 hypothetical protein [Pseudomonas juntendi]MBR7520588.1 hypothetical protein [Pseudomonas juntendi]
MDEPVEIEVSKFQRYISDTHSIATYQEGNGVVVQFWEGKTLLTREHLTYEEYTKFREDVSEYQLPNYIPPAAIKETNTAGTNANGNTVGRVVGEVQTSNTSADHSNPPVENQTTAENSSADEILDKIQFGLDLVGLIPIFGEAADISNGFVSFLRGDYTGAALSFASAIPFIGWAGTTGKMARRGSSSLKTLNKTPDKAIPKKTSSPKPTSRQPNPSHNGPIKSRSGGTVQSNKKSGDAARDHIAAREGAEIEKNFRVTGGLRRVDILKKGGEIVAIESKVGRTGLNSRIRQELARDVKLMRKGDVDRVVWEFSRSARTQKSGPTPALQKKLDKLGIETKYSNKEF